MKKKVVKPVFILHNITALNLAITANAYDDKMIYSTTHRIVFGGGTESEPGYDRFVVRFDY